MTVAVLTVIGELKPSVLGQLQSVVRAEFACEVIHANPDNPVFARGRCQVSACGRGAWSQLLCDAHYNRWRLHGRPDRKVFLATTPAIVGRSGYVDAFDLRRLPSQVRLEIAYSIQGRHDDRTIRLLPVMINRLVDLVSATGVNSLLDLSIQGWAAAAVDHGIKDSSSRMLGQLRYAWTHLNDLVQVTDVESEYASDRWRACVLGIGQPRGQAQIRFDKIDQLWLRAPFKRACRFRLGTGKTFGTVSIDERALNWFSRFLAQAHPEVTAASALNRAVMEHYLSWLVGSSSLSPNTTNSYLVILRAFLDSCIRHQWMPGLSPQATLYLDELPPRSKPLPRFIPEYVMAQLESEANLQRLPDATTRHLLILIQETGLRANDACALPFNPIIVDSVGWPCLQFYNSKMAAEQLVPLSQRAADTIRAQQAHLPQRWPSGVPVLFPSPHANPDGLRSFAYATFSTRLARWCQHIRLHDETGQAVSVTAHQFRHTLGTRLINAGVPQHVVQKMLGHASPQMTARYATLHDSTVRAAFDEYQQRRVNIDGNHLDFDPDASTADAEWIKHNLARAQASLPNGYCGRPPQQDCPHPNACLTCPDFQTTPTFLPIHRRQHDDTLELIEIADQRGNQRLAANHRRVAANLQNVITALETIDKETPDVN